MIVFTLVYSLKYMAKDHLIMPFGTKTYRVFCQQQLMKDISSKCVCVCSVKIRYMNAIGIHRIMQW